MGVRPTGRQIAPSWEFPDHDDTARRRRLRSRRADDFLRPARSGEAEFEIEFCEIRVFVA
jgi:hypothetical protein